MSQKSALVCDNCNIDTRMVPLYENSLLETKPSGWGSMEFHVAGIPVRRFVDLCPGCCQAIRLKILEVFPGFASPPETKGPS